MAEDVIDIRKRIEEIRNEVSSAIQADAETVIQSRPAGEVAEFAVAGVTSTATSRKSEPQVAPDTETLTEAKGALDTAATGAACVKEERRWQRRLKAILN